MTLAPTVVAQRLRSLVGDGAPPPADSVGGLHRARERFAEGVALNIR